MKLRRFGSLNTSSSGKVDWIGGEGKKREGGTNGRRGVREARKISANTVKSNKNRKNEREKEREREKRKR